MRSQFCPSLDIKLIRLVKKNAILYDHNELKYMDVNTREVIWHKIADELERPAQVCKARWVNIRDNMRKKLKERYKNPHQRAYDYKYEQELAFVVPFYKDISTNVQKQGTRDSVDGDDGGEIEANSDGDNDNQFEMQTEEATEEHEYSSDNSNNEKPLVTELDMFTGPKKTSRIQFDADTAGSSAMNESSMTLTELNPSDAVDVFLMSVGVTLKSFSPYYLNKAKSKIFSIVQEYELKQIVNKQGQLSDADCE